MLPDEDESLFETILTRGSQLTPEDRKELTKLARKVFAEKASRPRESVEAWSKRLAEQLSQIKD